MHVSAYVSTNKAIKVLWFDILVIFCLDTMEFSKLIVIISILPLQLSTSLIIKATTTSSAATTTSKSTDAWGTWTGWSHCSVTCGTGIRIKKSIAWGIIVKGLIRWLNPADTKQNVKQDPPVHGISGRTGVLAQQHVVLVLELEQEVVIAIIVKGTVKWLNQNA